MPSEHIVQLFDSPESLTRAVGAFAAEGLVANEHVLIVARVEHWQGIAAQIEGRGCDAAAAQATGQLLVRDAAAVKDIVVARGRPDVALFDRALGDQVRRLVEDGRPLRIYGEVVDLFAEQNDFVAAAQLEELWNGLGRAVPFRLFCGYSSVHFGDPRSRVALNRICTCHSEVRGDTDDDLASWLLSNRLGPHASA